MYTELLQQRIDYFVDIGYITYNHNGKEHPLMKSSFMLVLKIFSMVHGLSFPRVNANNIRQVEVPDMYVTDLGFNIFVKNIQNLSEELFSMVAPIFKGQFTPATFVLSEPKTLQNIKGLVGKSTRKTLKKENNFHVLVNNDEPFEYLKGEYIFKTIYEARTFINKLLAYVPEERLELYRVRKDEISGRVRRDKEPLTNTRGLYKV